MKFYCVLLVIFFALCVFANENRPASTHVYFSPNQPVAVDDQAKTETVLYTRVSSPNVNNQYSKITYYKVFEVIITLPESITTAADEKAKCDDGMGNEYNHEFTPADNEKPASLLLSRELEKPMQADHVRIFCYGLPAPTKVFKTETVAAHATVNYFETKDSTTQIEVSTPVTFNEVVEKGYKEVAVLTYELNTGGVKTKDVEKSVENLQTLLKSVGLDVALFSVTPDKEQKKTFMELELVSAVDHDILHQTFTTNDTSYLNTILKVGKATPSKYATKIVKIPYTCDVKEGEAAKCGGDCFRCKEGTECTADGECVFNSCVEGKCVNKSSSFTVTTTVALALIFVVAGLLF